MYFIPLLMLVYGRRKQNWTRVMNEKNNDDDSFILKWGGIGTTYAHMPSAIKTQMNLILF